MLLRQIAWDGMDWMLGKACLGSALHGLACPGVDKRGLGGHLASLDFNWQALSWIGLAWLGSVGSGWLDFHEVTLD